MKSKQESFISESEWQRRLLNGEPFLDVRAPIEFASGSLPGAVNFPILNDQERHEVGTDYKVHGPEVALRKGHQLVSGEIRQTRLALWHEYVRKNPNTTLYCFRGGQRSGIAQEWLKEVGLEVPRIDGGYKKIRQFLMAALDETPHKLNIYCLSGQTGAGKTHLLRQWVKAAKGHSHPSFYAIDLEGLAKHRGSAFGLGLEPQPSQADFENQLALELMRAARLTNVPVWFEDEARTIGSITVADPLYWFLRTCPLFIIEESRESRAHLILDEYVAQPFKEFTRQNAESATTILCEHLTKPVNKIFRKLGGTLTAEIISLIENACAETKKSGEFYAHLPWITLLLEKYYDPYYDRHLERQAHRVKFRGSRQEISPSLGLT